MAVWSKVLIFLQICKMGVSSETQHHSDRIWSTCLLSLHQDCTEIKKDTQFDFYHFASTGLLNCSTCYLPPLLWRSQNNFHGIPVFSQLSETFLFGAEVFHAWSLYQKQSPRSWFQVLGELEETDFLFKLSFLNCRPGKLHYGELLKSWSWLLWSYHILWSYLFYVIIILYRY